MEANVSEELKCKAINIFTSIGESCADVRKQQEKMLQQFVMQYIIPSLVPSDEKLQCWLESGEEYEFQDNSLESTCENSISNLAFVLGKKVINPLLLDVMNQAITHGNYKAQIAAVTAISCAAQGMADVIKQSDVKKYTEVIVKLLKAEHPRVRFESLNAISILSKCLEGKIAKYHKLIIPSLIQMKDEPVEKVKIHISTALVNYMAQLSYEDVYEHFDILTDMIRTSINAESLIPQSNGLTILSQMCTMADMEDVEPLLTEFMPQILQ